MLTVVSFFVLLAIFPAITALVSAYGLFFNPATIANDSIASNNPPIRHQVGGLLLLGEQATSKAGAMKGAASPIAEPYPICIRSPT